MPASEKVIIECGGVSTPRLSSASNKPGRPERASAQRSPTGELFSKWVSEISSNREGMGVLCVEITPRVQVVTWPVRRRDVTREDPMNDLTRRDALKAGGATVAAALLPADVVQAAPTWNGPAPEPDAQLRVLRWKQFVQSEFDSFIANTKKFVE
jgi:TAT (twin-arginine translocation) pathway-exported protein